MVSMEMEIELRRFRRIETEFRIVIDLQDCQTIARQNY